MSKQVADDSEQSDQPLMPFKDEVLGVATSGLKTPSTRLSALACLFGLVSFKVLLSDEELGFVVHNVNGILQADPDETDDARYSNLYESNEFIVTV